jgi:polar amino acid transport system ATP-binding protein
MARKKVGTMKIVTSHLNKSFTINHRQIELFSDLSFSIEFNRVLALIGCSGSGKTTLLRMLAGLEIPDSGVIVIDGEPLQCNASWLQHYRKKLGFVFQQQNLFPHYTALENVLLPLTLVQHEKLSTAQEKAFQIMQRLQISQHASKKPHQLSGGEMQRVAIARALVTQPRFLFLDEPTASLDVEMKVEILDLIAELQVLHIPIVLVTHEIGFARRCAEQILFMDQGAILAQGESAVFFDRPEHPRVQKFLSSVLAY